MVDHTLCIAVLYSVSCISYIASCDSSLIEVLFLAGSRDYYSHTRSALTSFPKTVFSEDNLQSSFCLRRRAALVVGGVTERGPREIAQQLDGTQITHKERTTDSATCLITLSRWLASNSSHSVSLSS